MNEKKIFEPVFVLESKRNDKIKSWSFRPLATFITSTWCHWFLTKLAVYILRIRNNQNLFIANRYSSISCIKDKSIAICAHVTHLFENLRLTLAKKRCEWECNKTIISENFCDFPSKSVCFQIKSNLHLSDDNCWKALSSILRQNEQHEQIEIIANHGPFCKRIKTDNENILKLIMWKRQWM